MPVRNQNGASRYEVVGYSLPKLHTGKRWFVDFLCFDPAEGKMRRKKYHLDGIKSVRERRAHAHELIVGITEKLRKGWNVWVDCGSSRQYTLFDSVCKLYITYIEGMSARGALKVSTTDSYASYLRIFRSYLEVRPFKVVYIYQFDRALLVDFLDYIYLDKEVSARTRNNYLLWLSTFSEFLIQKGFLEENPTKNIKKLAQEPKFREQLEPRHLKQLREYLERENKHYLLACMLEYYTFIRPEELCSVRIKDISVKQQRIVLSGEFTKNRKDGVVGLNDKVLKLMIELGIFSYENDMYLFGSREFRPSYQKQTGRIFREYFQKMRRKLKWPACYQFYSLKDTGIRDLANEVGIVVARDQARHSNVNTTNKYLKAGSMKEHDETKHYDGLL